MCKRCRTSSCQKRVTVPQEPGYFRTGYPSCYTCLSAPKSFWTWAQWEVPCRPDQASTLELSHQFPKTGKFPQKPDHKCVRGPLYDICISGYYCFPPPPSERFARNKRNVKKKKERAKPERRERLGLLGRVLRASASGRLL